MNDDNSEDHTNGIVLASGLARDCIRLVFVEGVS